ncbi:MAG: malto-oligosyltrehalose trehalohydrolase [Pseudomonadota bacterium]|nr:malto-oligosyltrehalose trehalohydrolase [Pseudomonadota bacterium]
MRRFGHHIDADGRSAFCLFAPQRTDIAVVLPDVPARIELQSDALGYWTGGCDRLPEGTRYWIETDGRRFPDIASRRQPGGVHAASAIATPRRVRTPDWKGVALEDAVIYELHLGTFTPEGTLEAARGRIGALSALGVTAIELLPIAAFPGRWNWGYDGVYPFALHAGYGSYDELAAYIETAHAHGIAVILDVVHNHFGPEGNYTSQFGPYALAAQTPWGSAINFNREFNHGVRAFFLDNVRYWLQDIGFDGLRMDAVSMIYDDMPVHILREMTDLARSIAAQEGREILLIAEHLRSNRFVTAREGFGFDTQWNDDLPHAISAFLTGERQRHHANFGSFEDVVKAIERGFVLDGTRFDQYLKCLTGTDGRATRATEHLVYIQNHDQVGNRPFGDRMIGTYGRQRALLALTAMFASPYVPMLFMGDEYGETAPFLFFEDFGDPALVEGVRAGRRADYDFGSAEPPDPHAAATFQASRLNWALRDLPAGAAMLAYCQGLIAAKRAHRLGPRDRSQLQVSADYQTQVLRLQTADTLTVLNFSDQAQPLGPTEGWDVLLTYSPLDAAGWLPAHGSMIFARPGTALPGHAP